MAWNTSERNGKIFFDYNQNSMGKTIASIFSARPTVSATISMPVRWQDLSSILPTDFTLLSNASQIVKQTRDPWNGILQNKQDIKKILESITEIKKT